jgi:hypothetical protein
VHQLRDDERLRVEKSLDGPPFGGPSSSVSTFNFELTTHNLRARRRSSVAIAGDLTGAPEKRLDNMVCKY